MYLNDSMRIRFATSMDDESQLELRLPGGSWRSLPELLATTDSQRKQEKLLDLCRNELAKASRAISATGNIEDILTLTPSYGVRVGNPSEDDEEERHWRPFGYSSQQQG